MTNAEARAHLKDILYDIPNDKCIDWIEALEQAIRALEQEQYYKDLAESYEHTITNLTKALADKKFIVNNIYTDIQNLKRWR